MVVARITDPIGPRTRRGALPALGLLGVGVAAFVPTLPLAFFACFLGIALLYAAPLLLRRRAPYDATLELGPGRVEIAGRLTEPLLARELTGASTARLPNGGVLLALASRSRRGRPMLLELVDDADARRVCDALGIGHAGFGRLVWPTGRRGMERAVALARAMAAVCILAGVAGSASEVVLDVLRSFIGFFVASFFGSNGILALSCFVPSTERGAIALGPQGLTVPVGLTTRAIAYASIVFVSVVPEGIRIDVRHGPPVIVRVPARTWSTVGLSAEERAQVVAQIATAARRAQGEGEPAPVVPARVADLASHAPGWREGARMWLEQLDATASLVAHGGYRGAGVDEEELWATLDNHDADVSARTAAARILVRVAPEAAAPRVASVLATLRDDNARRRMRVALLPDVDEASRELEWLEQLERKV